MPLVELDTSYESLDDMMREFDAWAVSFTIAAGRWTVRCAGVRVDAILPAFQVPFRDDETRQMVRDVLERALHQALGDTEISKL